MKLGDPGPPEVGTPVVPGSLVMVVEVVAPALSLLEVASPQCRAAAVNRGTRARRIRAG